MGFTAHFIKYFGLALLTIEDFVFCIRKQIFFQRGRGGNRHKMYYTAYNHELVYAKRFEYNWEAKQANKIGDEWGMIVFIYCARRYGFNEDEIKKELKLPSWKYRRVCNQITNVVSGRCENELVCILVKNKIKLVHNSVRYFFNVKPMEDGKV